MKTMLVTLLTALLSGVASAQTGAELEAEDAWVREGPPTARVLAGYLVLHNRSERVRTLTGASSPRFGMVEIHQTVIEDGMARMLPQEALTLAPGSQLTLEPGGYHLMLMRPEEAPRAGEEVLITLQFADGEMLPVHAVTRRVEGETDMQHDHSHHGHH